MYQRLLLCGLSTLVLTCSQRSSSEDTPENPRAVQTGTFQVPEVLLKRSQATTRLVWLSLDSLQLSTLQQMASSLKEPLPKGLKWIVGQKNALKELEIKGVSITAPSHISTITCSPPGETGIFNNSNWNGTKDDSGFNAAFAPETLVQSFQSQGLKVASVGYPAVDFSTPERSAKFGVTYDNPKSPNQFFELAEGESVAAKLASRYSETPYEVTLRRKGKKILVTSKGIQPQFTDLWGQKSESSVGEGNLLNLVWKAQKGLTIPQAEQTSIYFYGTKADKVLVAVYGNSKNTGGSAAYVKSLEDRNLVFPATKEYSRLPVDGGPEAFRRTLDHRTAYFASAAHLALDNNPDVLFLYLEDIDTLRHALEGTPLLEKNLALQAVVLDRALDSLFQRLDTTTDFVVMGDHGMSAINYEWNASQWIPASLKDKVTVKTSGGALFVYPAGADLSLPLPTEGDVLQGLQTLDANLRDAKLFGAPVVSDVLWKGTESSVAAGLTGTKAPWIVAKAVPGHTFKLSVEQRSILNMRKSAYEALSSEQKTEVAALAGSLDPATLPEPVPLGAHGHDTKTKEMMTSLILAGPRLGKVSLSQLKYNIQVGGAVGKALGWKTPKACGQ